MTSEQVCDVLNWFAASQRNFVDHRSEVSMINRRKTTTLSKMFNRFEHCVIFRNTHLTESTQQQSRSNISALIFNSYIAASWGVSDLV